MMPRICKVLPKYQITLPKEIREDIQIQEGDEITLVKTEQGWLLKKIDPDILSKMIVSEPSVSISGNVPLQEFVKKGIISSEAIHIIQDIINGNNSILIVTDPNENAWGHRLLKAFVGEKEEGSGFIKYVVGIDLNLNEDFAEKHPIVEFNVSAFKNISDLQDVTMKVMIGRETIVIPEILNPSIAALYEYSVTRLSNTWACFTASTTKNRSVNDILSLITDIIKNQYDQKVPDTVIVEGMARCLNYIFICGQTAEGYRLKKIWKPEIDGTNKVNTIEVYSYNPPEVLKV